MKRRDHRILVCLVIMAVLRLSLSAGGDMYTDSNVHHFQMPCDNCHQSSVGNGDITIDYGVVTGDINTLCTQPGCHSFEPSVNHPMGIPPRGRIPDDLPLGNGSQITCLTCHDELSSASGPSVENKVSEKMLRRSSTRDLCAACHDGALQSTAATSHWRFLTRAHLGPVSTARSKRNNTNRMGRLDSESHMCLTCHDNMRATILLDNETPRQRKLRWKTMASHPIGMLYENAAQRRIGRYTYPLMDEQIRLFDGRVGCGSCHNPYSKIDKMLTMPNHRGSLCLRCHIR